MSQPRWRRQFPGTPFAGFPAGSGGAAKFQQCRVVEDMVFYVSTYHGFAVALDASTGRERWFWVDWGTPATPGSRISCSVTDGLLHVRTPTRLFNFNKKTGALSEARDLTPTESGGVSRFPFRQCYLALEPTTTVQDLGLLCRVPVLSCADCILRLGSDGVTWLTEDGVWYAERAELEALAAGRAGTRLEPAAISEIVACLAGAKSQSATAAPGVQAWRATFTVVPRPEAVGRTDALSAGARQRQRLFASLDGHSAGHLLDALAQCWSRGYVTDAQDQVQKDLEPYLTEFGPMLLCRVALDERVKNILRNSARFYPGKEVAIAWLKAEGKWVEP